MIITLGIIITFLVVSNIYTLISIAYLKNDIEDIDNALFDDKNWLVTQKISKLRNYVPKGDYTIHENLMHDRINKLEEYLGIKRVQKEETVDKYVKVPKSK
jgi:hypothetical protein